MSTKKKIFIIIGIAVISAALYGYKEYNRKNKDLSKVKADVVINCSALIEKFEKNEQQANQELLDKVIAVSGGIREIVRDEKGACTLVLGEKDKLSSVRCSMDSVHQKDVALLFEGKMVTVKGACTGFNADELLGSDVILNRCVVQK